MSVLLIGSTGVGKSTLGNFLLDPDENMFEKQTFAVAKSNRPTTQEVKVASKKVKYDDNEVWLKLIDTPGLNESAEKDLSHMIDIIKMLNECGEIKACIFIVKFNAKIDAQYRATIEYYSKLLPGLFDNNVIIVMTDYATDERSEKMRERQHIDVEEVKSSTIEELCQCSNPQITYSPQLFMIDCLPLERAQMETSKKERAAILDYISQLQPIKVKDQMVAKTDYIKRKDAEKYEKLDGEINGYNERLKEVHTNSKKVLDDTRAKEMEIAKIEGRIRNHEKMLLDKDTPQAVVAKKWSINEDWERSREQSLPREFTIKSRYKIIYYYQWTNAECKLKDIKQISDYEIKVKVEGHRNTLMSGIYASVTAYTEKRIKFADKIKDRKEKLKIENDTLKECKEEREVFRNLHKEKLLEIELLQKYIAEKSEDAKKCQVELMTMEEATLQLEELKKGENLSYL